MYLRFASVFQNIHTFQSSLKFGSGSVLFLRSDQQNMKISYIDKIAAFLQIERVNYFLHNIVKTARRGDEVGSRTVACLLGDPINGRLFLFTVWPSLEMDMEDYSIAKKYCPYNWYIKKTINL